MMQFVIKSIRSLFFSLDKVIYGLIADVYGLLIMISKTTIFSGDVIAQFASRIYALAGIFMLFKVTLSIIHYVVNPDDFTEKEKGFSSIWKRILISLVLLVMTPYIFREAYNLQEIILRENTIMNLVFGTQNNRDLPNASYEQSAGRHIQFTLMHAFIRPNIDELQSTYPEITSCNDTYVYEGGIIVRREREGGGVSQSIYALNPECYGTFDVATGRYGTDGALSSLFTDEITGDPLAGQRYQNYAHGVALQEFGLMMRNDLVLIKTDLATEGDNDKSTETIYLIDYKMFVSTAVGIAVVYLLGLFCIDIAVRSVKLGFLQMISPIPILSYIDPKSGKDGMFKHWYKMCVTTYMSLFLRLFALYMGIYAITVIGGYTDFVTGEEIKGNWILDVFMIVGILIFAKQLPKIIEDIFGIKMDGKFTLNPLKNMLGAKAIQRGAVGMGAGLGAGLLAGGANLIAPGKKGVMQRPLSALAGFASGFGRGASSGLRGDKLGKSFSGSYSAAMQAKQARADRIDDGVGFWEMQRAKFAQNTGGHTRGEAVKSANESLKKLQETYKSMEGAAVGNDTERFDASSYGAAYAKYNDFRGIKGLQKYIDEVKKTSINRSSFTGPNAETDYLSAVRAQQGTINDLESIKDARLDSIAYGIESSGSTETDMAIREGYSVMRATAEDINKSAKAVDSKIGDIEPTLSAKKMSGVAKGVSAQLAGSETANHATTVDRYAANKKSK